jgi:SRSO17 transposase
MTREELRKSRALLRKFLSRYRKHLGRKEVQALVETYVTGLLSDTRKRNAEAMALEIGGGRVRALQRLLVSARWDEDAVVRERERDVAEIMGSAEGIFVVDDTGFRKKGNRSCGVGRQYSGTLGKVENCQIGVFLGYALSGTGHTLLDRKLYLQKDWFAPEMEELRTRAHMPDNVVFRTKHELALEMIEAAGEAGVPHSWVNMDADYGKVPKFLDALDGLGERYAAQVPSSTQVWTEKPKTCIPHRQSGKGRPPTRVRLMKGAPKSTSVKAVAGGLPRKALQSAILREGEKGPIRVEVAHLRVWNKRGEIPGREEHLVIVRRFGQKPETKYILSNARAGVSRMEIAQAGLVTLRWSWQRTRF